LDVVGSVTTGELLQLLRHGKVQSWRRRWGERRARFFNVGAA